MATRSAISIRSFRASSRVLVAHVRRAGRVGLAFALTLTILPLPSSLGGTAGVALAAGAAVPYKSVLAYPQNPTAVRAPGGVIVAPDGDVIIADTGNNRVRVMSASGSLKATIGSYGSLPGQLRSPGAVALGQDNLVYVADTGNSRVQVFQRNGTFVRGFGSAGAAAGQMNNPGGIAVGPDGRVYVSDSFNARIQVFSPLGVFLETWGSYGDTLAGQFYLPTGIAVDSGGWVYVVDTNKHQVRRYNPTVRTSYTEWGWTAGTPNASRYSNPVGITIAGDGNGVIVADSGNCRVERCSSAGVVVETTGTLPVSNDVGKFNKPSGAAVAPDGTWVVADTNADRIQRRSPAGVWSAPWSTPSTATPYVSAPEGVAADVNTGVSYIADTANNRVLKYDVGGAFLGSVAESGTGVGQVRSPKGLLVLDDGTLLVSDTGNSRILRFGSGGEYQGVFGAGVVSAPRALAVSNLGTLYVADTGNNRIAKFSTTTWQYQSMIGSITASSADGLFNAPRGVAVYGNALYVADTGNNRVQKLNASNGAMLAKIGSSGVATGTFVQPSAVLADATGVVVADTGNDRLQRFDILLTPASAEVYDGADTRIGSLSEPAALASNAGGRTLVLDRKGCQVQVLVRDAMPPVTTVSGVPVQPAREATLTFDATDADSAVAATYARTDGVTTTVNGPLSIATEGTHTVAFWSVDIAGNIESEQTTQVVIVRTEPVGTMQVDGGAAWTTTTTVSVDSSVTDATEMRVGADGTLGPWVAYQASRTVELPATDGTHTVNAEYRDGAGTVLVRSDDILLDLTGPDVTGLFSATHPSGLPRWGSVVVGWDPAADLTGVAGYSVSLDTNPVGFPPLAISTTATSTTFSAQSTGTFYVHARARDLVGNWGPVTSLAIDSLADGDAPVTVATGVPSAPTSADVTVTLNADDAVSGVVGIRYSRDGGAEATYTAPLAFTTEGAHTVAFHAVDRAGNTENGQSVAFTIDRTAPSGTMQVDGGAAYTTTTTVSVDSAVTGAAEMRVGADGTLGPWVAYQATRTVELPATDGTHTVNAEYRDVAGNVLTRTRDILLDRTGPGVTGLFSASHQPGVPSWGGVAVAWDPATDPSGIAGYAISFDTDPSGSPLPVIDTTLTEHTLPVVPSGDWYVHVMACDNAGNWGPAQHIAVSVMFDTDAPETRADVSPSSPASQPVSVSLEASESLSGLAGTFFRRDGQAEEPYSAPLVFSDEGTHTLTYWSADKAGNVEAEHTVDITVDLTAPVVTRPAYAPYRSAGQFVVRWGTGADLSGVVGYAVAVSPDPSLIPAAEVTTTTPSCLLERNASGPRFVLIRAVDAAGNWSATTVFDATRRPVGLSRPVVTLGRRTSRGIGFTVSGEIDSSAATGTVSIVVQKLVGGVWKFDREIRNVPLVAVQGADRMNYESRQVIAFTPRTSPGMQLRASTRFAGNSAALPAASVRSAAVRLR